MEMHQVRYFLAASRTLNFTRAAEECHVAQPSLTRAIKLLEAELGGDVFRRERNLTHLTVFGQQMLPLMRQCYEGALAAKKLAVSIQKGAVASLTLALSHSVSMALLVSPLRELLRVFPALELRFLRGTPHEIAERLKKGEAAMAIAGPLGETWDRLDAWPLFSERFDLVVAASRAPPGGGALADFAAERLLTRPYCELADAWLEFSREHEITFGGEHAMVCDADLMQLVGEGLGVAILPKSTPCPEGVIRIAVADLDLKRTLYLYAVAGRERDVQTAALMNLLRARAWEPPAP
ncbi:LysR family transcriptional regulator [Methylocella silvestris]|uniref:Transcriptional regulator n=1 Tax=Methylocella silvestris TaxID=199596 RepID=A0A2J7TES8_METSI|nr:LysR family transcriptional regulator [Methylocella silvestris]PNG25271.1 transcriptional regulator [Methylocella silvestris]